MAAPRTVEGPPANGEGSAHDAGRLAVAAVVAGATLASLLIGLHGLAARPLSEDEMSSVYLSGSLSTVGHDGGNMLLYYLVLHLLGGSSLFVLRLPSVLFGTATVPVVFDLGRKLVNKRVGAVAAVLFSVALPVVFWQQNARGYTLGVLLATASTLALVYTLASARLVAPVLYFLCVVGACYTQLFAAIVVAMQLLWLGWRRTPADQWKRAGTAVATAVAACVPLAVLALHRGGGQISWIPRPGLGSIAASVRTLMGTATANGPAPVAWLSDVVAGLSGVAVFGLVAWAAVRLRSRRPELEGIVLLALLLVGPPLVAFGESSVFSTHLYLDRYFLVCVPGGALLLAAAIDRCKSAITIATTLVLLVAAHLALVESVVGVPFDAQAAAAFIASRERPGDCVQFVPSPGPGVAGIAGDFEYYRAHAEVGRLPRPVLPAFRWLDASNAGSTAPEPDRYATVTRSCKRLWVVGEPAQQTATLLAFEDGWFGSHHWTRTELGTVSGLSLSVLAPAR